MRLPFFKSLCALAGFALVLLDARHLLDTARVTAVAEGGTQENLDDLSDLIFTEQIGAEAENVAMIVFAGAPGRDFIMDQRGANPSDFICYYRHADPAAVEKDPHLVDARGHVLRHRQPIIRIIHTSATFASEILHLVPELFERRQQPALGLESSMIACDGNLHSSSSC